MGNWMTYLNIFLPVIGALAGVWSGGYLSNKGQTKALEIQINRERERVVEEENNRRYATYNQVLKIDGEKDIDRNDTQTSFSFDEYISSLRPILYENFHVLDIEIARTVREIDDLVKKHKNFVDIPRELVPTLLKKYKYLIREIEYELDESRK